ncbi:MAG TPA: hypothetical protein VH639_19505 [Bryobacteraceae bacterium]
MDEEPEGRFMQVSDVVDILEQYRNASVASPPQTVQRDYEQAAQAVPSSHLADALTEAFRSKETPPFGQMLKNLFTNSTPDQRAGILNQLLSAVGPAALGSGAFGGLAGMLRGSSAKVTPDQAKLVSPDAIQQLAEHAEKQNPSIIDEAGQFYSQHPKLVQALGAGSLALIMSHLSKR